MGRKSTTNAGSRPSTSNAPAVPSTVTASNNSSILKSSFAPTSLQLHLFASVIQSFESQQLRIHDTNTGRLRQQHSTKPGSIITCLDWGFHGATLQQSQNAVQKKRKRIHRSAEDVVVGYGTSTSEICMYSLAEGRIVGQLSGVHEKGIKDFKFSQSDISEAWSLGADGKLVQWDLVNGRSTRTVALPDPSISVLAMPNVVEPRILCASTAPFSVDLSSNHGPRIESYDSFRNLVHTIIRADSDDTKSFLAADNNRYISIFDIESKKMMRTLVTSSEVEQLDLVSQLPTDFKGPQTQVLAVTTRDGTLELFAEPFSAFTTANSEMSSKRKNMTRKAAATIKLVQPESHKPVRIVTATFDGDSIVLVSIDGGVEPIFQKVRWQDEGTGGILFSGIKEVAKSKTASALNGAIMNGVKDIGKAYVDDSRTVVANGNGELTGQDAAIEITSDDDADEQDAEDESDEESEDENAAVAKGDGSEESDVDMEDAATLTKIEGPEEEAEMEEGSNVEPSFGDLLASKHPDTIAIADAFAPERSTLDGSGKQLAVPAGMSLGTVLTQALRTNDQNLLESCLHANDAGIIQNTIQRLDSSLASNLLSKLAERLASRPGRYGHLLSWVQWTCIAHGGAIAGQPDVAAKLRTLYRVLSQRSKSLDKLLLLKGKLDMLDAQLKFRKQLQAQRGGPRDSQDEPGIIYIEGQEDNWSSDEDDHDEAAGVPKKLGFKTARPLQKTLTDVIGGDEDSDSEEDEEMPITNGIPSDESDEDEDDDDDSEDRIGQEKEGGLVDVEAEVSGEDEAQGSESDENGDEDDDNDDEEDDEDDSSMDSFINDGEISVEDDEDDVNVDGDEEEEEDDDTPKRPLKKRSKHR